MPDKTLSQVFQGLLAAQTGVMQGQQQKREFDLQQAELARRAKLQDQDQVIQLFGQGARFEDQQFQDEDAADEAMMRMPNLSPVTQQEIAQRLATRRASRQRAYTPESFRNATQGGGLPSFPSGTRQQTGPPIVPQFFDPVQQEAYANEISNRQATQQPGTRGFISDPAEQQRIQNELTALRRGKSAGTPLERLQRGAGGLPPVLRPGLPSPKPDEKAVAAVRRQAEYTIKQLDAYVAAAPDGSEARKLREAEVGQYRPDLVGLASQQFSDPDALQNAQFILQNPRLTAYIRNDNGTESRAEAKLNYDVAEFRKNAMQVTGGLDTPSAPSHLLVKTIPALYRIELDLAKKSKGVLPLFASEKEKIERLEAINKALDGNEILDPAKKAEFQQEALDIAQEVQERLKSGLSPNEERRRYSDALKAMGELSVESIKNGDGRAIFENLRIPHLYTPGMEGARAEKLYSELVGKMPAFARMDKKSQGPFLRQLIGASRLLGKDLELPADFVLKLEPTDRELLALDRAKLSLQGTKLEVQKARFALQQADAKSTLKTLKFGEGQKLDLARLLRGAEKAQAEYNGLLGSLSKGGGAEVWAGFDPEAAAAGLAAGQFDVPTPPKQDKGAWQKVLQFFGMVPSGDPSKYAAQQAGAQKRLTELLVKKWKAWKSAEDAYSGYADQLSAQADQPQVSVTPADEGGGVLNGGPPQLPQTKGKSHTAIPPRPKGTPADAMPFYVDGAWSYVSPKKLLEWKRRGLIK